jgi:hypothetical protein
MSRARENDEYSPHAHPSLPPLTATPHCRPSLPHARRSSHHPLAPLLPRGRYVNFQTTFITLFLTVLGEFDFDALISVNMVFGYLFFLLYQALALTLTLTQTSTPQHHTPDLT